MSYKLGLMLSMVFLISVLLLGADLCLVNAIYQQVDSIALVVSHRISMEGALTSETTEFVEAQGAAVYPVTEGVPAVGDVYTFYVEKAYTPLIMGKSPLSIRATRSCIVGFYQSEN